MGKLKVSFLKLAVESTVSAYIQLPVGVHEIGDKRYTVSERVENEGLENEYRTTVIDTIEPLTAAETPIA